MISTKPFLAVPESRRLILLFQSLVRADGGKCYALYSVCVGTMCHVLQLLDTNSC